MPEWTTTGRENIVESFEKTRATAAGDRVVIFGVKRRTRDARARAHETSALLVMVIIKGVDQ